MSTNAGGTGNGSDSPQHWRPLDSGLDGESSSAAHSAGDDNGGGGGRLRAELEREGAEIDAAYFLPSDSGERKRLQMQHIVLRQVFGGLFHTPQRALLEDPSVGAKVLDVGCGPGFWTLEMATKFPHASFIGA
ncbi:hypothetical protein HK405_015921, partial [Cladochytrium tenue]